MILTDRTLTVNGNSATLDSNIYLYRGDRNVELNFSIVNSKYRFTKKDSDNIIDSTEAVYSIFKVVSPNGEELVFPVTPIEDGMAKWVIEGSLIDELDEVGKYDLQIRLLDSSQQSIITMPPILGQVEILEPLFGDINALTNQDTTGKARTSVLSATQRPTLNEDGTYNKKEWVKQEIIYETDLNTLEDIASKNRQSILDINKEFLSTSESKEGSYLTFSNAKDGSITNLEILGNTVQSSTNLADIQSVGTEQEDRRYKMSILSCSKNLFDGRIETLGKYYNYDGSILNCATSDGGTYSLKIKPNTQYKFSNCQSNITFWDKDLKFISGRWDATSVITSPENAMYVRVLVQGTKLNTIQIEEGTTATTYEPYQCNKTSILLPCPLEKVGDVSDRLFRREDGVWCVEKNVGEVILNGSESWNEGSSTDVCVRFSFSTFSNIKYSKIISNIPTYMDDTSFSPNLVSFGICSRNNNTGFNFHIEKSKLSTQDVTGFKTWLSQNPTLVKYQLATPQIIELPLDTQIQLNSFNGVTNIFTEDTVIEPTIKATVPKSLGASVNSLVNKTDILSDRVEKISSLQKGNEMIVSTDKKSVVVQSTNEGYVTDFNIKGNTLVNLVSGKIQGSATAYNGTNFTTNSAQNRLCVYINNIKENTNYTVILFDNSIISTGNYFIGTSSSEFITKNVTTVNNRYLINSLNAKSLAINLKKTDDSNFSTCDVLILEGDHTDKGTFSKDLSYFEGLKSVGDGTDKINLQSKNKSTEPSKVTTKELLYKNAEGVWEKPVLRKVSEGVYDSIELHSDGKYYYHKRCGEVVLNGSESWVGGSSTVQTVTKEFNLAFPSALPLAVNDKVVCNNFNTNYNLWNVDQEGVTIYKTPTKIAIKIDVSKLSSQDLTGFKTWLQSNPTTVVYQLATEEVYECTDIDLNAYDDTTFLSLETGYINPQYSCNVSAHIGNVVSQIKEKTDTLEEKVGELLDDRTKQYETENGYVVAEDTKEGNVEELKIEGNTLVNIVSKTNILTNNEIGDYNVAIKPNTTYTIIGDFKAINSCSEIPCVITSSVYLDSKPPSGNNLYDLAVKEGKGSEYYISIGNNIIKTITTKSNEIWLHTRTGNDNNQGGFSNLIILEGDHTQNPPSYFEGLKSVGDGVEEIEVLSRKEDGNLLDENFHYFRGYIGGDDRNTFYQDNTTVCYIIPCIPNTTYVGGYSSGGDRLIMGTTSKYPSSGNKVNVRTDKGTITTGINDKYLIFYCCSSTNTPPKNPYIFKGVEKTWIPQQSNKKQILFKNSSGTYEKPILRSTGSVSDTIEKHSDGKYYFHKRCGEVIFDGSSDEGWFLQRQSSDFIKYQLSNFTNKVDVVDSGVICDKFNQIPVAISDSVSCEGIADGRNTGYAIIIVVSTSRNLLTAESFKTWLQANPVTVVYQLATEEVYECVNLDLDSYEGETSVIVDSGAISPKLSFKIASHIANTVQVLKDRINYLENKVMDMFKAVLCGDVQTLAYELYPEDFENSTHTETVEGTDLL